MSKAKESVLKILQELPEDASYDEIVREPALARMIERGLADSEARRVIGNEEMERRIRSWVK